MKSSDWDESLSIKIKGIDDEHKVLFKLFNKLRIAMREGKSKEELGDVITGLVNYVIFHFETEQKLFEKYDYPHKDEHNEEHQKIVEKVHQLEKEFHEAGSIMLAFDLLSFMVGVMIEHIKTEDRKYEKFFLEISIEECI